MCAGWLPRINGKHEGGHNNILKELSVAELSGMTDNHLQD